MTDRKTVYVVHCIDTEGPLYESPEATVSRVNEIFDLDLEPSAESLRSLQSGELDHGTLKEAVRQVIAPRRLQTNESWDQIDSMLNDVCSDEFRDRYPDSTGSGWIYNWFCLDHVGFTGENPRRRDIGHHNIFDHYRPYLSSRDSLQWHYHPLAIVKDAHRTGTTYLNSSNIYEILSRKVIDRKWFPAAFRPGFHTERPDSHWFLEQWIPFDYANQRTDRPGDQPDLKHGRFGDWRRAPVDWWPYHPDFHDYQKRGNCNRYISRCLNIDSRIRELRESDVRDAFNEAQSRGAALLSFTNHDWRDMGPRIDKVWNMIARTNEEFDQVEFEYVTAVDGMRLVLGLDPIGINLSATIDRNGEAPRLIVSAESDIFGPQPFLALKTRSNDYHWQNFDFNGDKRWSYTFDFHTLPINCIDRLGVAANSPTGVTEVITIDPQSEGKEKEVYHY